MTDIVQQPHLELSMIDRLAAEFADRTRTIGSLTLSAEELEVFCNGTQEGYAPHLTRIVFDEATPTHEVTRVRRRQYAEVLEAGGFWGPAVVAGRQVLGATLYRQVPASQE